MRVFRSFEEATGIRNPVVTTGTFDGVHIGHKTILNRLRVLAQKYDGESVLITFDPHPRKVLYPDSAGKDLKLISSQEEKLFLLEKTGLDNVIIVEFTREFSRITSEQFVRDFLRDKLKAKVVVVGFNHHFGFNKEGDYRQLWEWREKYSFEAEEIPEQEVQHETVSSTRIRQAVSEGYMQRANAWLDHYYIIIGKPEAYVNGSSVSLPSLVRIPLTEECKLLPSAGIYAVSVSVAGCHLKGMAIIGQASGKIEVFLHLFDTDRYFPGEKATLFFHKKISRAVDLSDEGSLPVIRAAMTEIGELIY